MGVRKSAAALSASEASGLRQAFEAVYGLADERGYAYFAGLHGLPLPSYCEHGTSLFLPWHRAYLYFFERALRDRVPSVTLPWWDWTSTASHTTGLPPVYVRRPASVPNPLAAGPVTLSASDLRLVRANLPGALTAGRRPMTRRDPDVPSELPQPGTVRRALGARSFTDFSMLLEGIHNSVHGWVGGAMSAVPVAAYDPVFWAHHSMMDRLWYLWQIGPNGSDPPTPLLGRVLTPFPVTVRDTLDLSTLGYEYAVQVIG